ncbi:MAG TPA: alpha/beta hydrolase, partial [Thermoanaerobaculia bacterium]|nr:alpha/beta hydrolase [Thermoanaerobaculia bacterium]
MQIWSVLFAAAWLASGSAPLPSQQLPHPPAQPLTLPLWPAGTPGPANTTEAEHDTTKPSDQLIAGRPLSRLTAISQPSLAFYPAPASTNTGAAVIVFPGGGYRILAYDLEGTEVCTWLNASGINCILVKYRVPETGRFPANPQDLEDAQQAIRITRSHASEWRLDPHRTGVLGFSAGAHLAVALSTNSGYRPTDLPPSTHIDTGISARPDFALVIYPGYLAENPTLDKLSDGIQPTADTPPTFVVQAEDDPVHVENALVYYQALKAAKVPAELHVFAQGGHGYGLRPTDLPVTH